MDVINYTVPVQAPVTNTVERVITQTKEVPVLPARPLTQAEIDYLMYQAKANERLRVINSITGAVTGLGVLGALVAIFIIGIKATEAEEENDVKK